MGQDFNQHKTPVPCWFPAYVLSDIPEHQEMYTKNENDLLD